MVWCCQPTINQCNWGPNKNLPPCGQHFKTHAISWMKMLKCLLKFHWNLFLRVHPCEKVIGIYFRHNFFTIYFLLFVLISYMIYVRWSILNLLIFVVFRSLVTLQWYFEKGYWVKTRCHISLIYAGGKDSIETWEKRPVLVHSLNVGVSNECVTNYRKPVVTHKSIH